MADTDKNAQQNPNKGNSPAGNTNTGTSANAPQGQKQGNAGAGSNPNPTSNPSPKTNPNPQNKPSPNEPNVEDGGPNKGNSPIPPRDTPSYESRAKNTRDSSVAKSETARPPQERDLDRAKHVSNIMGGNSREGERRRLQFSGRSGDTVIPTDEAGKGNPSVETPDRVREKVFRDSENTELQETYRERDLTNGRQQTTDSHFRRDMIQEQMPRIPPSMLGTVGRMVDTPESVALRQDDKVYEAMRPPTAEELFELGAHPEQEDAKVQEDMKRKGVVRKDSSDNKSEEDKEAARRAI